MTPNLVEQYGPDTRSKWERAAPRRLLEAQSLVASGHLLAAIYLFGYSIEMHVKAAYFRLLRYGPHVEIDREARSRAEAYARQQGFMSAEPHDFAGWARLLVHHREFLGQPFQPGFGLQVVQQAVLVYDQYWRPRMRYRTTDAKAAIAVAVEGAAGWFHKVYPSL